MTPELLAQVAETYRVATPPRHKAIALAFDVSDRTAQRYIAHAREGGLIDA
jgi:DNA-binding transcriptional regulator LsrR (DeoR family)